MPTMNNGKHLKPLTSKIVLDGLLKKVCLRFFMDAIRRESMYQFSQLFSVTLCTKCSSPRRSNRRWGKARASLAPGQPGEQREEQRGILSAVGLQAAIDRREGLASQGRH